ncbi:hypothetical protein DRF65_07405 [Chryseobacterium pennae]|uniref:AAA domain-containing protein n=1 Tax=Chryseobacterium pennae TaxID=2258962 RepID=A0A3D9CBQ7_9FLAO|nr:AAA family ATPase [Chryseobacterium pennae]REC63046.1 hypothetical protein DRF65_07405 [Chryseobacterium pennae]
MSKKLTIKNIGPIKEVSITIKKINIFMGRQSSGKSTIAKILSFCSWVEKEISFHQSLDKFTTQYFIEKLETFHKMKGYFYPNSEIIYKGEAIEIKYSNYELEINWLHTRFDYKRTKISYIPSERSMVILPEMEKIELPNNYLKSYLYDWFDTRKNYNSEKKFSVLDIGANYYYSEDNKESHIVSDDYDILLSQASSGLQSVIPLLTMVDNLIINLYKGESSSSYELDEAKIKVTQLIVKKFIVDPYFKDHDNNENREEKWAKLNKLTMDNDNSVLPLIEKYREVSKNLFNTHKTNLIIEEPEQNLFPSTQKQLCYKLLNYLNNEYDHSLTLTTHSPYILYAINNCMLTYLVKNKIPSNLIDRINCYNSAISPDNINIFEIKNGTINNIQQENGLIGENYFDSQMKEVMDDFYFLLNFLD